MPASITFDQWQALVRSLYPTATFTHEDGPGATYGPTGSWTAHTGPDMQADVVGVFHLEGGLCWVLGLDGASERWFLPVQAH